MNPEGAESHNYDCIITRNKNNLTQFSKLTGSQVACGLKHCYMDGSLVCFWRRMKKIILFTITFLLISLIQLNAQESTNYCGLEKN